MDWDTILTWTPQVGDTENWGSYGPTRIRDSFPLDDDIDNAKQVARYIRGSIAETNHIAEHSRTWPDVYHPNAYLSHHFDALALTEVLEKLEAAIAEAEKEKN